MTFECRRLREGVAAFFYLARTLFSYGANGKEDNTHAGRIRKTTDPKRSRRHPGVENSDPGQHAPRITRPAIPQTVRQRRDPLHTNGFENVYGGKRGRPVRVHSREGWPMTAPTIQRSNVTIEHMLTLAEPCNGCCQSKPMTRRSLRRWTR